MKRLAGIAAAGILGLAACSDNAVAPDAGAPSLAVVPPTGTLQVTTSADAGPGSLRAALAAASADPSIRRIRFARGLARVELRQTVTFTGPQEIEIDGAGATVSGAALGASQGAVVLAGGGDVAVRGLTVQGAPGVGLTVLVPDAATGVVRIALDDVHAADNGLHGVLINDQTGYLADPESTSPAGSAAGLEVAVMRSSFERNGFAAIDQDGLRVNEGGAGDLRATIRQTRVVGNGGDGVELDERGVGDAAFAVSHTWLEENGAFTAEDYDDGIDVDESGDGDIDGRFVQVEVNRNLEQGVDLNENDAGDLRVTMDQVTANDNAEEGVEFEEDDDFAGGGDIVADLRNVTTLRNGANDGDAGLKLREKGAGSLRARVVGATSSDNAIGGILVREDAAGDLDATLVNAAASANGADGIAFDENGAGTLTARVQRAVTSGNDGAGVAAEQAAPGAGALRVQALVAEGNADGPVKLTAVTLTSVP